MKYEATNWPDMLARPLEKAFINRAIQKKENEKWPNKDLYG